MKAADLAAGSVTANKLDAGVATKMVAHGEESALNSENKTLDVECVDDRMNPMTGGALLQGGEGFVALTESRAIFPPATANSGWRVSAIEVNGGTADDWKLIGQAQCGLIK